MADKAAAVNQSRECWRKAQAGQIRTILKDSIKINTYSNIINSSSVNPACYLPQCSLLWSNYPLNPFNPFWPFSALIVLLGLSVVIVQIQLINTGLAISWWFECKEHSEIPGGLDSRCTRVARAYTLRRCVGGKGQHTLRESTRGSGPAHWGATEMHKTPTLPVPQGVCAGCKPLSLETFKQMTEEGSEHLVGGVEKQEGDPNDHKDFSLPLGSMIQCDLVRQQIWWRKMEARLRVSASDLPSTNWKHKIQSKRVHLFMVCSIRVGTVGI